MRQSWSVGLAVVLACAGGVTAAIEDGLVGSWSFAGSDGRTVADTIGGRTGTIEAGEVGRDGDRAVLQLDGVGDGVVITLAEPLPITKALTALLWVKPTVLRDNTVLFGIPHSTPSWTTPVIGVYLADGRPVSGLWLGDGPSKVLVAGFRCPRARPSSW